MISEIEKPIPNFDGYSINIYGEVFSIKRKIKKKLKTQISVHGYIKIKLNKSYCAIHRLVAITFIANPKNCEQVNHKDGNKKNNHISNLEWCTAKQNILHAYRAGAKRTKLIKSKVEKIKILMRDTNITNEKIAKRFKCSTRSIEKIRYGENWPHIEPILHHKQTGKIIFYKP